MARLVLFGAFACGSAGSQEASTPAGPTNIQVISGHWLLRLSLTGSGASPQLSPLPQLPPGITIQNARLGTFTTASSAGSIAGAPDKTQNRLPLPVDGSAVKIERAELHVYSMELSNNGPKVIKAFSWDFIFAEPRTDVEQLRHSFANVQKIEVGQKKTARFTTALAPPKVVDAAALGKDPRAWPREYATLQCVLFADGSTWELPNASGKPCDRLARWLERRKTWRPGLEDFPFNP